MQGCADQRIAAQVLAILMVLEYARLDEWIEKRGCFWNYSVRTMRERFPAPDTIFTLEKYTQGGRFEDCAKAWMHAPKDRADEALSNLITVVESDEDLSLMCRELVASTREQPMKYKLSYR